MNAREFSQSILMILIKLKGIEIILHQPFSSFVPMSPKAVADGNVLQGVNIIWH